MVGDEIPRLAEVRPHHRVGRRAHARHRAGRARARRRLRHARRLGLGRGHLRRARRSSSPAARRSTASTSSRELGSEPASVGPATARRPRGRRPARPAHQPRAALDGHRPGRAGPDGPPLSRQGRADAGVIETFAALQARNYRLYWIGLVFYVLGHRAEYVTFAWITWEVTRDPLCARLSRPGPGRAARRLPALRRRPGRPHRSAAPAARHADPDRADPDRRRSG